MARRAFRKLSIRFCQVLCPGVLVMFLRNIIQLFPFHKERTRLKMNWVLSVFGGLNGFDRLFILRKQDTQQNGNKGWRNAGTPKEQLRSAWSGVVWKGEQS